jgi:ankyrin repeat protein
MKLRDLCILPALLVPFTVSPGAEPNLDDPLYQAIRNRDLASLKSWLKTGDVNTRDTRGATPLMYTAAFGTAEAMKLVLDAGADVNAKNSFDATALIWAAGDPVKSRLLLEHGADVNARSKQGRMPLMVAAHRDGSSEIVRLMLTKGADVTAKDAQGNGALMLASQNGDVETMRLLIASGADVNARDTFMGITPLMNAVASNGVEAVRLLLSKGAIVNIANTIQPKMRNGLLAAGKMTPLMWAAPWGSSEMLGSLLKAGADANALDIRGMTALMLAVASETQDVEVVKLLIKGGADVNISSTTGETALDWASKFGNREVIAALQHAGARDGAPYSAPPAPRKEAPPASAVALEKSIGLLQRSSTEYFKQSGCVGCHHQPLMELAVKTARKARISVDETAAAEQMAAIKAQAVAGQESALEGIDQGLPDINLTLLEGLAAGGYLPDIVTDSLAADIASLQRSDGSLRRGPAAARAPISDSDISRTAKAVQALRVYGIAGRKDEFDNRIARARKWLADAKPRTTDESAMLLLSLSPFPDGREKIRRIADALVAQQHKDGGWAGNPNLTSDAFATGEALYSLREGGFLTVHDAAYQKGVGFLLRTQYPDGSWYVRSRAVKIQPYFQSGFPFDHDQWISAAGTAWASMAVAATIEPGAKR